MALCFISSEIKRYNWSKIVKFSHPLVFDAPVQGVPVGVLPYSVGFGNTRMMGLSDGEKTEDNDCVIV